MCGDINDTLTVVTLLLAVVILYLCGCFVKKISSALHKECNCNKIMVVTFTANSGFFLRRFRDPIRVPRISNRVPRIRENYHRVPKISENGVP